MVGFILLKILDCNLDVSSSIIINFKVSLNLVCCLIKESGNLFPVCIYFVSFLLKKFFASCISFDFAT